MINDAYCACHEGFSGDSCNRRLVDGAIETMSSLQCGGDYDFEGGTTGGAGGDPCTDHSHCLNGGECREYETSIFGSISVSMMCKCEPSFAGDNWCVLGGAQWRCPLPRGSSNAVVLTSRRRTASAWSRPPSTASARSSPIPSARCGAASAGNFRAILVCCLRLGRRFARWCVLCCVMLCVCVCVLRARVSRLRSAHRCAVPCAAVRAG